MAQGVPMMLCQSHPTGAIFLLTRGVSPDAVVEEKEINDGLEVLERRGLVDEVGHQRQPTVEAARPVPDVKLYTAGLFEGP